MFLPIVILVSSLTSLSCKIDLIPNVRFGWTGLGNNITLERNIGLKPSIYGQLEWNGSSINQNARLLCLYQIREKEQSIVGTEILHI